MIATGPILPTKGPRLPQEWAFGGPGQTSSDDGAGVVQKHELEGIKWQMALPGAALLALANGRQEGREGKAWGAMLHSGMPMTPGRV